MTKVKDQFGEMAKCVEDQEMRITDLAKLFFKELSGKDNTIHNNLLLTASTYGLTTLTWIIHVRGTHTPLPSLGLLVIHTFNILLILHFRKTN